MSTPPEDVPLSDRRAHRLAEAAEQRQLEGDIWWYCCFLSNRERMRAELARQRWEEERLAKLHYEHVLERQQIAAHRWPEICRLRSLEIYGGKIGLVIKFESYMRKLDRVLAAEGIWIGSYTQKILEDPQLGTIPQLPANYEIPSENSVVDLT